MKKALIVDDVKGWQDFHYNVLMEIFSNDIEIETANSASSAYDILLQEKDFDFILTDLQMEDDYAPKYAGEWLVEQIKAFNAYKNTKIVIISASYNVRFIAETLGVKCIPKSTALKCFSAYQEIFNT